MYHGDIRLGDTLDVKFTTRSFSTGAPTQLAGSPVISAYVDNSTTQITAGITLTVDFDSVTGLNHVRVVATSGNGYATATNVELVITTGTVGGVSVVGEVIGSFSIEARSALMPTTAARTLDVSAGGEAGVDWANVGSPTTTLNLTGTTIKTATDVETDTADIFALANGASGFVATKADTAAILVDTGTTLDGRIPAALVGGRMDCSVGAMATGVVTAAAIADNAIDTATFAVGTTIPRCTLVDTTTTNTDMRGTDNAALASAWTATRAGYVDNLNIGGAVASAADLATVAGYLDTEIASIITTLGAAGAGLTAMPWNAAWDAEVQSECADAIVAYDPPTSAEMDARTLVAAAYATAANQTTILSKTNSLTFTQAGVVDSNVRYVNTIQVDGVGSTGDPWGPV